MFAAINGLGMNECGVFEFVDSAKNPVICAKQALKKIYQFDRLIKTKSVFALYFVTVYEVVTIIRGKKHDDALKSMLVKLNKANT